jgi:hypothetical protein
MPFRREGHAGWRNLLFSIRPGTPFLARLLREKWGSCTSGLCASARSFYVFGSTIMFCGVAMGCGDPGACVTPVEVTVNTYNLP